MVNKIERQVIFGKHIREGDDEFVSSTKTKELVKSQRALKILHKDYQKELRINEKLQKTISKLKQENVQLKQDISNLKLNRASVMIPVPKTSSPEKTSFLDDVSVEELKRCRLSINRIEHNMKHNVLYSKNMFIKDFLIQSKHIDFSLNYLMSQGLIESVISGGKLLYRLK